MHSRTKWPLLLLTCTLALGGCEVSGGGASGDGERTPAAQSPSAEPAPSAGSMPYAPEIVATGLQVPWEIDFAPDGRIFFTERGGSLKVIENGKVAPTPVFRFADELYKEGEAGLLGFTLDPQFAKNGWIYVYHSYEEGGQAKNRVVRLKEQGGQAAIDQVILEGLPGSRIHDGGRVKFGPDGMLYVTSGDASEPSIAQDVKQLGGKILRIRADGTIPPDNPFPGSPVYSLGHRNPQGLAWQPGTRQLFSSEHGQTAHDEINRIEPGANYGWPLIQGDETQVKPEDQGKLGVGPLKKPLLHSGEDTWAPSGITFVTRGPWAGQLLAAGLRGEQVLQVKLTADGQGVQSSGALLKGELGRIRTVAEAPDGSLYVLTNNRDGRGTPQSGDDKIIRFKPVNQ